MPTQTSALIETWVSRRGLTRAALQASHNAAPPTVQSGVSYEGTSGLDLLRWPGQDAAFYYYQGDTQVMMMVSDESALDGVSPTALRTRFGAPEAQRASRAGKEYTHHVHATQGVAWSDDGSEVAFVELFAPTTIDAWAQRFYVDPGAFIK